MGKVLITPRFEDTKKWASHNVFQTTCTVSGRVCKQINDSGSCGNIISKEAAKKLNTGRKAPISHKLSWIKKGNEIPVTKYCLVHLSC